MSAKDAHRQLADHAMTAAHQRDKLLVTVLEGEKEYSNERIYSAANALAHNNLAIMPGVWETLINALGQLYDLRRIAHEIMGASGVATNDAIGQEEA
jgi:hypothetical protein